jgi:signal transduction histidine kinase
MYHRKVLIIDDLRVPLAKARGLFLKMDGPASMPVESDQAKVLRILQNLVLNALKYTECGGVMELRQPVADQLTDNWMFCIHDTGPGLDGDPGASPLARKIHESTQSAQAAEQSHPEDITAARVAKAPTLPCLAEEPPASEIPGEGVGLSIAKRLCELLDASLELETSPDKGSTFRVMLPRQYEAEEKS